VLAQSKQFISTYLERSQAVAAASQPLNGAGGEDVSVE